MTAPDTLAWPDWLADLTDAGRLAAILAAVSRCYAECPLPDGAETSGPHLSKPMARQFLAQMMERSSA